MIVVITLLQALGRANQASTMSLLRQIVLFIPCVILLPKVAAMGIRGVWTVPALVDAIIFIICMEIAVGKRFSSLKATGDKASYLQQFRNKKRVNT